MRRASVVITAWAARLLALRRRVIKGNQTKAWTPAEERTERTERQIFHNRTSKPLEVWVEMYPDLYVLQPDDRMEIIYKPAGGYGLEVEVHDDCLVAFLQEFDDAIVKINGAETKPINQGPPQTAS
jgi:hypothetical protein